MKTNIISFRKIVAFLGFVVVVGSPTTIVITSFISSKQTKQITGNNIEMVVNAINATQYEQVVDINSSFNDLKKEINAFFMKEKLAAWVRKIFKDNFFTLNKITKENGKEISDADLQKTGIINAKINYNYSHKKNQVTTLKIEVVSPVRPSLSDAFKNFHFVDDKKIEGFLDANDIDVITKQVLDHLGADDLNQIRLIFTNRTSNSITLKAKSNSKLYSGEVKLTWNLKFFEIYGFDMLNDRNPWIAKGLKGFFYLDKDDNKIKFFDFQNYAKSNYDPIHSYFTKYHHFIFTNKKVKDFTFNGEENAGENGKRFGTFAFDKGLNTIFYTPEPDRVKVFNKNSARWEGFIKSSEFDINDLGELKIK
ncbi:MAG: hypothetical protein ACRC8P_00980 [Spiroplasma sp.]